MEDRVLIVEAKAHIGFSKALHEEQHVCLEAVMSRKDVLAVLPTGFGKSLIYQLVPFVISLQRGVPLTATKNCVLVITPLNSIMTDQCTALSSQGISSCAIDFMCHQAETFSHNTDSSSESDNDDDGDGNLTHTIPLSDVEKGLYRVVYAHPEALIKTKRGYSFLEKLSISGNLVGIAIDEAHIILEW